MHAHVLHRAAELRSVEDFLASAAAGPSALIVEGEAGIGKTTVWLAALEEAGRRGVTVLPARPSAAEVTLAHATVADLLRGVAADRLSALPPPQRLAVSQVLRIAAADEAATDPQAIGAALLSVLEGLAAEGPVLLAVDDAQWLDASSAAVVGFVIRRLSGPVGVLVTVRTAPRDGAALSWLHLPRPEAVARVAVQPLPVGALHVLLTERLGRPVPRPAMMRIHQICRGNPFYALELGRSMDGASEDSVPLPESLGELVRGRIGGVGRDLRDLLLAAASLADPTVELLQAACRLPNQRALVLVGEAEDRGLLVVHGNRVRFAHPLLAAGVRADAGPAGRREMHRHLAEVVSEPEQRARHLALAAVRGDPETLQALDRAAVLARTRGAPAAAAELLELAIGLGGATPERRLQAALHRFDAGDIQRSRSDLEALVPELPPGTPRARTRNLLGLVRLHDDSFVEAATVLAAALEDVGDDLRLRVDVLLGLAYAELNVGRLDVAHARSTDARATAARLGDRQLRSRAEGFRVMLDFVRGNGLDEAALHRALRLEGGSSDVRVEFRPSAQAILLQGWTGRLDAAAEGIGVIRRACMERGEENDLVYLEFHSALFELWRGDIHRAARIAEAAHERARLLDRDVPLAVALSTRGLLAAHVGRIQEARADAEAALAICRRCGWPTVAMWPMTALALIEVSTGRYQAAVDSLEPLLSGGSAVFAASEIISSPFVPDAVEALVQLGRIDEAEALVEPFERNGRRLDRPWALAIGGRGRAMLLAARGDVDAACVAAERAMAQHDRLPMPFERARTQLLLGQLQRRRRKKEPAAATLGEALQTFERLGMPLWAERARAELARVGGRPGAGAELTASERRVAELAASGMTNREVAAELFISPKTVEANLVRIYRKLDIRSRAELGRLMASPGS